MTATEAVGTARREVGTIALVSAAHFASHFMQLALAPLLPLMRDQLGVSFTELGIVVSCSYTASALAQAVAGGLVDRFGAHRLLRAGITLQALSITAMAFVPNYYMLLPLAVLAGLGNSVYHPADMTILSRRVGTARHGRAYAVHGMAGSIGFGVSPLVFGFLALHFGWRAALFIGGAAALSIALMIALNRSALSAEPAGPTRGTAAAPQASFLQVLASPVILMAFGYMVLTSIGSSGIQTFGITTLTIGWGETLATATLAITLYQLGSAAGILAGGILADRTARPVLVALLGLGTAVLLVLVLLTTTMSPLGYAALFSVLGLALGITVPSRDMLVRQSAPAGGLGKVFGVVYSGFDVGSLLAPLAYGLMLDHHAPDLVFATVAVMTLLTMVTVVGVGSKARRQA